MKKNATAFIEIGDKGENFISEVSSIKNIWGAFCLPKYRGIGIFQNLLNYSTNQLSLEGYQHMGVDLESFNPTAAGF